MSDPSRRLLVILGVFGASLVAFAAVAALFGGDDGFMWALRHGASGPFAVVVLHHGSLNAGNLPLALLLVGAVLAGIVHRAKWLLPLALVSAVAWILLGLSVGV